MNKELALLWDYQQLDVEVDKLENKLKSSEERQKALYYKNVFNKSQEEMQKIEASSESYTAEISELEKEIEGLAGEFTFEIENEEDLELAKKCAADIAHKISKLEKALKEINARVNELEAKLTELGKRAIKAKKEYGEFKAKYDALKQEMAPAINKAKEARDAFAKKISKEALEVYNNVKTRKSRPIALLAEGQCMGCYMSLPSAIISKVRDSDDIIECENCGNIFENFSLKCFPQSPRQILVT